MSVPSNEHWKYRNSVPQINLLTPCQPPNLVQFSRDWNFYLSPQELVTPMSPAELAAYGNSLAPSLNQLRMDSSVQNFSQITVSRKTVATDDQNSAFTSTLGGSLINEHHFGFFIIRGSPLIHSRVPLPGPTPLLQLPTHPMVLFYLHQLLVLALF